MNIHFENIDNIFCCWNNQLFEFHKFKWSVHMYVLYLHNYDYLYQLLVGLFHTFFTERLILIFFAHFPKKINCCPNFDYSRWNLPNYLCRFLFSVQPPPKYGQTPCIKSFKPSINHAEDFSLLTKYGQTCVRPK